MRVEFAKDIKIISELLIFCNLQGARDYKIDLNVRDKEMEFVVTASNVRLTDKEMEQLLKRLSVGRRREMEQNYWGAGGKSDIKSEMLMVGMMVDEADVSYENEELRIRLLRLA
jgi:hypothetical protein